MKFLALVSGGKDSLYAILLAQAQGHELVGCVHLAAPIESQAQSHENNGDKPDNAIEESYMYQTAASEAVRCQVQDCLGVPFFSHVRTGHSVHTGLVYPPTQTTTQTATNEMNHGDNADLLQDESPSLPQQQPHPQHDEVDDLYQALRHAVDVMQTQHGIVVQAVCSGAILSHYQRVRVEYVACRQLQLSSLSFAWRKAAPIDLLHDMVHNYQMDIRLVKTAAPPGLQPHQHLGRSLYELLPHLQTCHDRYQLQICGEGGEYESLVVACPALFGKNRTLILDKTSIELDANDDSVGTLRIHACHAQGTVMPAAVPPAGPRPEHDNAAKVAAATTTTNGSNAPSASNATINTFNTIVTKATSNTATTALSTTTVPMIASQSGASEFCGRQQVALQQVELLPLIRRVSGGLWSISELQCSVLPISDQTNPNQESADAAVQVVQDQARGIFHVLQQVLHLYHCTAHDVVMVHVYLQNMAEFAHINAVYAAFFGVQLPPSRSTVAAAAVDCSALPVRIRLDCLVQCGSGDFMRGGPSPRSISTCAAAADTTNPYAASARVAASPGGGGLRTSSLREVLHVQSLSHWAPVCVGPYAQVNTLRGSVHFLAGQIGLVPANMQFENDDWTIQLEQSWRNVANVLDALDAASIQAHTLSCLIYVSSATSSTTTAPSTIRDQVAAICQAQIQSNARVIPGHVEGIVLDNADKSSNKAATATTELWGGYEDEETQLAVEGAAAVALSKATIAAEEGDLSMSTLSFCPILVVSIAQMPVGALTEIEVVALSRRTADCLGGLSTRPRRSSTMIASGQTAVDDFDCTPLGWDTGHDFPLCSTLADDNEKASVANNTIVIDASFRCLAGSADSTVSGASTSPAVVRMLLSPVSSAIVTARWLAGSQDSNGEATQRLLNPRSVLHAMLTKFKEESLFDWQSILHIRLYYLTTMNVDAIRMALYMALGALFTPATTPAVTLVPVYDMFTLFHSKNDDTILHGDGKAAESQPFLALQALSIDPIALDQSVWIHQKR